ncbi:hypothetical protein AAG906_038416 [Vitis piasezkii]
MAIPLNNARVCITWWKNSSGSGTLSSMSAQQAGKEMRQRRNPVTLSVQFSMVDDFSLCNAIKGRPWLHKMKVIPFTYHQMEKIAFVTPQGLYCYRVMSFGLKNVGATYQRLMKKIFKPLIDRTVEVYIDDIVVKSKTRVKHLNPTKCAFDVNVGKFLSLMVTQRGIEFNPAQVKVVLETPTPSSKRNCNAS